MSAASVCLPWKRNLPAASVSATATASTVAGIGRTGDRRLQTMRKPTGMKDKR